MKITNQNNYYRLPVLDGIEVLDARHHTRNFPFHIHDTFNITLVLEQTFTTRLPERLLAAPVGTIVITHPNEVHATLCDNRVGSSFFTFYVSPDIVTYLNNNTPVFFNNALIQDPGLFQQLFSISASCHDFHSGLEKALQKALQKLVACYATPTPDTNRFNTRFRRYLEEEIFEKFSLENAAGKFGLDKYKFIRLFKQETGLTPNHYVILKRIEKSKLLLQTNNNLLDIAIEPGFYDATHFCRVFRKITGITPLAYRKA